MGTKSFSQNELNLIVAARVKRERERLTAEFEKSIKKCMASIHLILHQEMGTLTRDMATETPETLFPPTEQNEAVRPVPRSISEKTMNTGGEQQ